MDLGGISSKILHSKHDKPMQVPTRQIRVLPVESGRSVSSASRAQHSSMSSNSRQHALFQPRSAPSESSNYAEVAVQDALQTLYHSEYVLMAEYVEFVLPMLYALYISVLYHLPLAKFYPYTVSMTNQKLVSTVVSIWPIPPSSSCHLSFS